MELKSLCSIATFFFSAAVIATTAGSSGAYAQNSSVLVTSGMGGGASSTARLSAQMSQQQGRVDDIEICGNKGRLFGPGFGGAKDSDKCLTNMSVNAGGGATVSGGLTATGGITASGNSTFNNNFTVKGTTESDGRIYADDGIHVRGDWLRIDGSNGITFQNHGGGWRMTDGTWLRSYNDKGIYTGGNIRTGGQFQINGNTFGPAPTCSTSQKLRWTGTAWQWVADLIGEGGSSETDPKVGTLVNGRWCTSNGGTINCTSNPPVITESDPQVATLQSGKWCTSNGSQINCTSNPPSTTETDPKVGTLSNGKWCKASGGKVTCTESAPTASAPTISLGNCSWVGTGLGTGLDDQYHTASCPSGKIATGWRCYATKYLDGNCAVNCCSLQINPCTLPWGGTIASGQSVTAYQTTGGCGATCNSQTRTCTNGSLSGSYTKSSCSTSCTDPNCYSQCYAGCAMSGYMTPAQCQSTCEASCQL